MRRIQEALKDVGVPVYAGVWLPASGRQNPPEQYLVYSSTTTEDAHQDDAVVSYKTFVYMNLWSDGDPTETAAKVRAAMYSAGFAMVEETDIGDNKTAYDSATRQFAVHWTWCLREEIYA